MAYQQAAGVQISPDGNWWWDGQQWLSTLSPDGRMRWNGQQWLPIAATAPAPQPAAAGAPQGDAQAQASPSPKPLSRRPLFAGIAAAAITALVLIVPALVLSHVGIGTAAYASTVKLAFKTGDVKKYTFHQVLDGNISPLPAGSSSVKSDLTATETLKVLSVDKNGVATVSATVDGFKGTVDGKTIQANALKAETVQLLIAADGRILGGGSGASTGGSAAGSVPGSDQFSSILPDQKAKPGDSWSKAFDRPNPLGQGSIHYSTTNRFVRYEDLGGINAAVIQTNALIPLNLALDLQKLGQLSGQTQAYPAGSKIRYGGKVNTEQLSWIDSKGQQLLKSKTSAVIDMSITFEGLPKAAGVPAGPYHFTGKETIELDRA
jgi:hypothetical protein